MSFFQFLFHTPDVLKMQERGDLDGLLGALGYSRGNENAASRIRKQAREALVSLGEPAIEPAARLYLYGAQGVEPRVAIYVLSEIGRHAMDPATRQKVANKLVELLNLRKENRRAILQGIYRVACQPNPPAFYAALRQEYTAWQHDPSPPIRLEASLGMLLACAQTREISSLDGLIEQIAAAAKESPKAAQRSAAALGEASGLFTDPYLRDKIVDLLLQIVDTRAGNGLVNEEVREASLSTLNLYSASAIPGLLERMEENPGNTFIQEVLTGYGRHIHGSPQEAAFARNLQRYLSRPNWELRKAAAGVLDAIPWEPEDESEKADILLALCELSLTAWSRLKIDAWIVDRLVALAEDLNYPGHSALARLLGSLPDLITDKEARYRLRGALARALRSHPPEALGQMVKSLAALDWKPGADASGAIYWIYKEDWEKAVAIGTPAVDGLILCLEAPELSTRRLASRALGRLYQAEGIDAPTRQRIISACNRLDSLSDAFLKDETELIEAAEPPKKSGLLKRSGSLGKSRPLGSSGPLGARGSGELPKKDGTD